MLATVIIAGGVTFASTSEAQQQPGKGRPGQDQVRPGQGQARPGQGQRPQRPGGGFSRRNSFEGLGLSEKQQKKITAIQAEQSAELRELLEELRDGGGDRQALGAKMTALREKYQKKTDAVLTDAQKKKQAELRAQRPQRGAGGRGNPFASLGLKEEQQKKLDAARQEMSTQLRALFTDRDTPREERTAKMQKIREGYEATIKKILTEDQFKKYQTARSAQGGRGQGQGRRPEAGGRGNPFASLGLKEEQQKKLDAARQEMSTQMRALFTDRDTPREERTAKLQKIREGYEATIKKALTEEQFKKYQEARPQRGQRRPDGQPGGGRPRPDGKNRPRPKRSDA
jgi:protein CpxP